MTRVILLRHGQSLANAGNLFAGHSDFDLTEFGRKQAELAAKWLLANESIDAIYASDLLRAYHTATPTGEAFGIPVVPDKSLREIFAGEWEGLSFSAIASDYPEAFRVWTGDYSHARPVGGESTAEVYRRVVPHICSLAARHEGGCILIASHATVVRAFEAFSRGYGAEEGGRASFTPNAALNIYEVSEGHSTPIRTDIVEHLGENLSFLPPIIQA